MITRNRKSVLSTVTPSAGGTQSNELQAAIKSVTSSITVGAVFLYDVSADSDGGAWRKKCKGLSWFDEPTLPAGTAANQWNSATRSARSEFPAMALIVADNESGSETLNIYDLDDPAMPLWMSFTTSGAISWAGAGAPTFTSVCALNGRVYLTGSPNTTFLEISFAGDDLRLGYQTTSYHLTTGRDIASRNVVSAIVAGGDGYIIVDDSVNDVAATVLEGAEIGALGLPIPTVAVATDGGVSVIHPSGDVYDIDGTGHTNNDINKVFFTEDGMVGYGFEASGGTTHPWGIGLRKVPYADGGITSWSDASNLERYTPIVGGSVTGLTTNAGSYSSSNTQLNAVTPTGKDGLAIGYADRLSIVKRNTGYMEEGAVAYITSTYNTGYMVGDIRFAGLAGNATDDRCVKANGLSITGTIDEDSADGGTGELESYSGFSANDYLSQAYDADFDFGTGDFSIMVWVKPASDAANEYILDRSDNPSTTANRINVIVNSLEKLYLRSGNETITSSGTVTLNQWSQVVALRRGGKLYLYINGEADSVTPVTSTSTVTNTSNVLYVGGKYDQSSSSAMTGSLSLLRISATAPTPKQIADIYAAEKPLFAANAKCLLAANQVNDLAYDTTSGLLHVASESTASSKSFRGLEAVESLTSDGSLGLAASKPLDHITASGGVVAGVGGETADADTSGCGVNLPSLDVRAELNEGESKIPDDGKFHFSGITTSNGGDIIGNIPVAEGEQVTVYADITATGYSDSTIYASYRYVRQFYRDVGGNITATSNTVISTIESAAALNGLVSYGANRVQILVTGDATNRMVWNATVEVIRDTEKSYER